MFGNRFGTARETNRTVMLEESQLPAVPNSATGYIEDPLLKIRVMIIDADFYKGIHDNFYSRFGSGASTILYEMGVGYGEIVAKSINEMGARRLEVYKKFIERGKRQGYGEFTVPILRSIITGMRGEARIYLKDSFFAVAVGTTGKSECWIVAGMIAGAAKNILGKDHICVEEKCISKGDSHCEFYLKSS